jgi:uncharacterized protein (TIGR02452 family)
MSNRKQRAKIAQETIEILERGNYQNRLGEIVDLSDAIANAKGRSIYYDSFYRVFDDLDRLVRNLPDQKTEFSVTNETTLHAARRLIEIDGDREILCLNFASAMNPGGGFLSGSQAQEESLARATALYPCLVQMNRMYEKNRRLDSPLSTDDMIYSPQVPVFRDDNDILLDKPFSISIVTALAVRANALVKTEEIEELQKEMFDRTEKLLSIAAIHGHKVLVLGAWGCGVFGNNPSQVARDFYHHLVENYLLKKCFTKVVFAVLDRSTDTIAPFWEVFTDSSINWKYKLENLFDVFVHQNSLEFAANYMAEFSCEDLRIHENYVCLIEAAIVNCKENKTTAMESINNGCGYTPQSIDETLRLLNELYRLYWQEYEQHLSEDRSVVE